MLRLGDGLRLGESTDEFFIDIAAIEAATRNAVCGCVGFSLDVRIGNDPIHEAHFFGPFRTKQFALQRREFHGLSRGPLLPSRAPIRRNA